MHNAGSFFPVNRYSAKKMAKPVNFICVAPKAKEVRLTGDFNGWDPAGCPMIRQPDGAWLVQVLLHHGHHQYRFMVDGKPVLDSQAYGMGTNQKGERVSIVAVS